MNATAASQLNRAISHGAEKGTFALPKGMSFESYWWGILDLIFYQGPSGKVKLAPKVRTDAAKEVSSIQRSSGRLIHDISFTYLSSSSSIESPCS